MYELLSSINKFNIVFNRGRIRLFEYLRLRTSSKVKRNMNISILFLTVASNNP